ncbi:DUF484 family protein [Candidatus Parabeggiatoa sp. HSG14]|uniref:DUF484 family protein n=1 Tax=Candidatus Parabeggiatoa sp. HSG14 TaxID=3055593 RepID=UPI0025A6E743|nr:DUF484 family protein [Thiotrichales bacterium HSG14]
MRKTQENQQQTQELPEKAVVEYLKQHPDFFIHHEDLLTKMEITHASDMAISLVEQKRVVLDQENRRLQEKNQQLQRNLDDLIAIAQQNEELNQRIRHLVVALTEVDNMDEFFHILYSTLCNEFNTDAVVVRYFEVSTFAEERQEFVEYDAQIFTLFENVLENQLPICGQLSTAQIEYLFPNSKIASAVLIPLGTPKQPRGLLAMGSHDASRFHVNMSTDLLQYLAELLSNLLKRWVQPV